MRIFIGAQDVALQVCNDFGKRASARRDYATWCLASVVISGSTSQMTRLRPLRLAA
jgi:hypothetical protein